MSIFGAIVSTMNKSQVQVEKPSNNWHSCEALILDIFNKYPYITHHIYNHIILNKEITENPYF